MTTRLASDCPFCGKPMVRKHRKSDDSAFLACSGFPACKFAENIDLSLDRIARQLRALTDDNDWYRDVIAETKQKILSLYPDDERVIAVLERLP